MEYLSVNKYLKDTFGEKIYKIALNGGFTCPNRDGTVGVGGCIFCSAGGSGEFAERVDADNINKQLEMGIKRVENKISAEGKFIAYFQAYTNTYGPIEKIRELFYAAINNTKIVALSIATRPDCLPDEVMELLNELNQIKPVWIELGLQTIHEESADYIRRGYALKVFDEAVNKLNNIGISQIIVHVILGLPGESEEDMLDTVRYVVKSGANGIKLQLLHVIKGTDLERDYLDGKFNTLTFQEYVDIICKCVMILPDGFVVHRITGDGDKRSLVAPLWSGDKKRVLNAITKSVRDLPDLK